VFGVIKLLLELLLRLPPVLLLRLAGWVMRVVFMARVASSSPFLATKTLPTGFLLVALT
jgi:hypothetical protein